MTFRRLPNSVSCYGSTQAAWRNHHQTNRQAVGHCRLLRILSLFCLQPITLPRRSDRDRSDPTGAFSYLHPSDHCVWRFSYIIHSVVIPLAIGPPNDSPHPRLFDNRLILIFNNIRGVTTLRILSPWQAGFPLRPLWTSRWKRPLLRPCKCYVRSIRFWHC